MFPNGGVSIGDLIIGDLGSEDTKERTGDQNQNGGHQEPNTPR